MRIEWSTTRKIVVAMLAFIVLVIGFSQLRVRFHVTPERIETCQNVAVEADVAWMVLGTRSVKIFVYGVGEKPKLWVTGGWRGKARTGPWVSDGLTVMLTDSSGRVLSKKTFEAEACPP